MTLEIPLWDIDPLIFAPTNAIRQCHVNPHRVSRSMTRNKKSACAIGSNALPVCGVVRTRNKTKSTPANGFAQLRVQSKTPPYTRDVLRVLPQHSVLPFYFGARERAQISWQQKLTQPPETNLIIPSLR